MNIITTPQDQILLLATQQAMIDLGRFLEVLERYEKETAQ